MNPSFRCGHGRRASALRVRSVWPFALVFAVACSRSAPSELGRKAAVQKAAADTAAQSASKDAREGGSGTRAKGDEGTLGAPEKKPASRYGSENLRGLAMSTPMVGALPASPAPLGAGLAAGSGYGAPGLRGYALHGAVANAPPRQMISSQQRAARRAGTSAELDAEAYASRTDNPFLAVKEHPLSTFSSDVDTASYSNARRFLSEGHLPPKDAIRVEEWLNYFAYDYAPPAGEAPVAIHSEVSACPWQPSHRLVRIGVQARPIAQADVPPRNLVFLVDVSGSMLPPNKLPLLKSGLRLLTRTLRPEDQVAIVVYAGSSGLVLPPTPGTRQDEILRALDALEAGGSTNGGQGIELAYRIATAHFQKGGINRVVLATDGDFNVGTTSEGELARLIEDKRKTGVFLTVLGFGEGNVKDSTMEMLADRGNGNYAYIDSAAEARRVLVREAGATLVTIAKDVKLQVEFNPARVQDYRLIGYENRLLADQDFNDDKKDAGDMGAGHSVTALYEVVPVGTPAPAGQAPPLTPLKYQTGGALAPAATEPELLTVSVRYKAPAGNTSQKVDAVVLDHPVPFESATSDHRFAVAVSEFAQILGGSKAVGALTLATAERTASLAVAADATGDRRELVALIRRAEQLQAGEPVTRAD